MFVIITLLAYTFVMLAGADLIRHVVPLDCSTCSRSTIMAIRARQRAAARRQQAARRPLMGVLVPLHQV